MPNTSPVPSSPDAKGGWGNGLLGFEYFLAALLVHCNSPG